jgi:hypothetical protein
MLPALIFCALVVVVLGRICYQQVVTRRLHNCDWNELFGKLEAVPKLAVAKAGDAYLNPRPNQIATEPMDIWMGLGGLEGIRRMRRNARILIALAAYAQRWNFTESVIVRERMRQDALHLQLATYQIALRMMLHMGQVRVAFHLDESVGSYHLMTKRLLTLYRSSHSGLYPRLVQVLGEAPTPELVTA